MGVGMARGESIVNDDIYRIAVRVALDSLPSLRRSLLEVLWKRRADFVETRVIAEGCEFESDTARLRLFDLQLLGIVEQRNGPRSAHTWRLTDKYVATAQTADVWQDVPTNRNGADDSAGSRGDGQRSGHVAGSTGSNPTKGGGVGGRSHRKRVGSPVRRRKGPTGAAQEGQDNGAAARRVRK